MGREPEVPDNQLEEDEIDQETASQLPSREVMSIIDPTPGPKIPYQPPDGFAADEGDALQGNTEVEDGRLEQ